MRFVLNGLGRGGGRRTFALYNPVAEEQRLDYWSSFLGYPFCSTLLPPKQRSLTCQEIGMTRRKRTVVTELDDPNVRV